MVYKIVLTGGPCSGKTTSIQRIASEFREKGYNVIIVPDSASLLINSGVKNFGVDGINLYDFQKCIIDMQMNLERIIIDSLDTDLETIALCDGGIIDGKAFMDDEDFTSLLKDFHLNELDISVSYDMVIHLRSFALGKEQFYTFNTGEEIEEAKKLDQKILESWAGHSKLRVVTNDGSFEEKMNRVCDNIYDLLKIPRPIHIQKKFLVDYIDLEKISGLDFNIFDIEKYVISEGGNEKCYKKTTSFDDVNYSLINKTNINGEKIVTEKRINESDYYDNIPNYIIKNKRYTFEYNNQYFKLDIFDDKCILEVDLTDKSNDFDIPPFVSVREDITDDLDYNYSKQLVLK